MISLRLAVASGALMLFASSALGLSVTPTSDPGTLAGVLLGSGVRIVTGSAAYSGPEAAAGVFTDGRGSGLGIEAGVILTTGFADVAPGPNTQSGAGWGHLRDGDAELTNLAGYDTFDAVVLEFDFETAGGDLFFNYVFASEEYNEYANTEFNDLFAFFLDGENLALLPGTGTPVGVNTVNGGNPESMAAPVNPQFFLDNDYREEDGRWFPSQFDLQYDGFTVVLTAQARGLSSGPHHIRLAIADAGDDIFDSAVFLQAGTFSDTPTPTTVPEPSTLVCLGSGLALLCRQRRRSQCRRFAGAGRR